MPTFVKAILYLLAELLFIVFGGCIGAWWPVHDIPAGAGGPGDGIAMAVFGAIGMCIGGMVGVVGLVVFWSAREIKAKNAAEFANQAAAISQDETVWPPAPRP